MSDAVAIEVFSPGVWGGLTWTLDDLDAMVRNFDALKDYVKPPLKLGHDDRPGAPAYGWIERLEVAGKRLIAHVRDIPEALKAAVRAGRYRRVSSEIYPRWENTTAEKQNLRTGVTGPVLAAIAALGAEAPEVRDLRDITLTEADTAEALAFFAEDVQPAITPEEEPTMPSEFKRRADELAAVPPMLLAETHSTPTAFSEAVDGVLKEQPDRRRRDVALGLMRTTVAFSETSATDIDAAMHQICRERGLDPQRFSERHEALERVASDPRFKHLCGPWGQV